MWRGLKGRRKLGEEKMEERRDGIAKREEKAVEPTVAKQPCAQGYSWHVSCVLLEVGGWIDRETFGRNERIPHYLKQKKNS